MKILITGGSGLLGKSLLETQPNNCDITLTWNKNIYGVITKTLDVWYKLDIRDRVDVFECFEMVKPDAVIHCAASGSVDFAEQHYQEVFRVNVTGLQNVIDAANGYKSKLVYISTNAVFSGDNPPYNEKSPLNPVNAYGVIKRQAERVVQDAVTSWLIVRPFLLYGWPYPGGRGNWANVSVNRLRNGDKLKIVNDHIWQPTYAPDCAEAIWELLFQFLGNNEIFNVAQPERITLYEFILKVCKVFDLDDSLVEPVDSNYFSSIAKRPKDTSYDLFKLFEVGIALNKVESGLSEMRKEEKFNE